MLAQAHACHIDSLNHYYMDTITKAKAKKATYDPQRLSYPQGIEEDIAAFIRCADKNASNEKQTIWECQLSLHAYTKVVLKSFIDTIWHTSHELLLDSFHEQLILVVSK